MKALKKKKSFWIAVVIAGLAMQFFAQWWIAEHGFHEIRHIAGIFVFAGAFAVPICTNRIWRISYEKEFPDLVRKEEIEYRDERNAMIRTQAKARSADIIQWFILLTAGLIYFSDCPLWPAVVLVGIYFLRSGIEYYYTHKYQKEM